MKKKEKRTGRSWRKKALTGILAVSMILQTSGMSLFAEENAGITKEAVLSESEVPAASAESVNQEAASDPGNTDVSVTEAPAEAVEGAETQGEVTTPETPGEVTAPETPGEVTGPEISETPGEVIEPEITETPGEVTEPETSAEPSASEDSQASSDAEIVEDVTENQETDVLEDAGQENVTIIPKLEGIIFAGTDYDLLKGVIADPSVITVNGKEVSVKIGINSLKRQKMSTDGVTYVDDPSYDWETLGRPTTITPETPQQQYVVTYRAYYADENGAETDCGSKEVLLSVAATGEYGTVLPDDQNKDEAYISNAGILKDETVTGTVPFDTTEGAGNDTSPDDQIVRSFDTISYTTMFYTRMQPDAQRPAGYEKGRFYFEIVLPYEKSKAQFETNAMGWLKAKPSCYYEVTEVNGSQVLRGSFMLEPAEDNPTAIGASYNELQVVLRVLQMHNNDLVQPQFTYWLEGNDVGAQYKTIAGAAYTYEEDGQIKTQAMKIPTGSLVTGRQTSCVEHGNVEAVSFAADPVTVSAAPRYNVQIKNGGTTDCQYLGTFNFDTGEDFAPNKGIGKVYGRIGAYGITLMMLGKEGQGMRGLEFPDENTDIQFDLTVSSVFNAKKVSHDNTEIRKPLLWSLDEQLPSETNRWNNDHRKLLGTGTKAAYAAPLNRGKDVATTCYNGGTWTQQTDENGTIHVTVQGFKINVDRFPWMDTGMVKTCTYYDPEIQTNYWDIENACFSAGEVWLIQPYQDESGVAYVDKFNSAEGTFNVKLAASELTMKSVSGQSFGPDSSESFREEKLKDNSAIQAMVQEQKGKISDQMLFLKSNYSNYLDALTEGCEDDGKDWATRGTSMVIEDFISDSAAEGTNTRLAYDQLVKFDDVFLEPSSAKAEKYGYQGLRDEETQTVISQNQYKLLWGAKPTKDGWNHQGQDPDGADYDTEMLQATADDLIFYNSLEELKAAGCVPVAVLVEWRGLADIGGKNALYLCIKGKVKNDCPVGYVYMASHAARAWKEADITKQVAASLGQDNSYAPTHAEYDAYVKSDLFPTREGNGQIKYDQDYPKNFWTFDYAKSSHIYGYIKTVYKDNKYVNGTAGRYGGDSCLVMPHQTSILAQVAQAGNKTSERKQVYDMSANQRYVDYKLNPSICVTAGEPGTTGGTDTTDVTIEVDLPEDLSLTYKEDSACWGGTYQEQKGAPGKVTGGINLDQENITEYVYKEIDGKQKITGLKWVLKDVTIDMSKQVTKLNPIYFSCQIGVNGDDDKDVKNGQQIQIAARISSTLDQREQKAVFKNLSQAGISVLKESAVSLSKLAEQSVAEKAQDMGFTMNVGNNSATARPDSYIIEGLPYTGEQSDSSFHGPLTVNEFSFGAKKEADADLFSTNLKFYYTTNPAYQGKTSTWYMNEDGTSDFDGDGTPETGGFDFAANADWKPVTFRVKASSDGESSLQFVAENLPAVQTQKTEAITAIAAYGTMPQRKTLKMHINLQLPEGEAGDVIKNSLTHGTLSAFASTYIVSRRLEGQTWLDDDMNGIRSQSEASLNGAGVVLMKLKENGDPQKLSDYEVYRYTGSDGLLHPAQVVTGQQMNLTTGAISTYTEGHYSFINLPKGTFGILFADRNYEVPGLGKISAALELTPYTAALSNVGDNDRIDSDGLPCYAQENDTEYGAGDLKYSFIPNILMPDESALSTRVYVSSANDAGFFDRDKASGTASLTGKKTVKGANPSAFEFGIYQDEACTALAGSQVQTNVAASDPADGSFGFTFAYTMKDLKESTGSGKAAYAGEKTFVYYVKENSDKAGYAKDESIYKIEVLVSNKKDDGSLKNDGTLTVTPKVAGRKAAGESDFTVLAGNDAVLEFVNIYQAKGSARITGTKRVSGGPLREDFTFGIYEDNQGTPGNRLDTATAVIPNGDSAYAEDGTGEFSFTLDYTMDDLAVKDQSGKITSYLTETEKTYYVQEEDLSSDAAGYGKDNSCYKVTVRITDQGDGTLQAVPQVVEKTMEGQTENADQILFVNSFAATGNASFQAEKKVVGGDMKAFSFNLYKDEKCTEKASDQIFTNDLSTGKIEFTVPFKQGQDYAFDMKDMTAQENGRTVYAVQELEGKTAVAKDFVYYIRENAEKLPEGYYSDNAVYKVTVTMKLDEDQGKAVLVPYKVTYQLQEKDGEGFTYKEAEPVFTNEFKVQPSPAPSVSPSVTPSVNPSVTPQVSPSVTPQVSPSVTPQVSPSVTPQVSPSVTPQVSPSVTPEVSPSVTPSASAVPGQNGNGGNPGSSGGSSNYGSQTQNVKTADETPIAFYLLLFAASAILILAVLRKKKPVD